MIMSNDKQDVLIYTRYHMPFARPFGEIYVTYHNSSIYTTHLFSALLTYVFQAHSFMSSLSFWYSLDRDVAKPTTRNCGIAPSRRPVSRPHPTLFPFPNHQLTNTQALSTRLTASRLAVSRQLQTPGTRDSIHYVPTQR